MPEQLPAQPEPPQLPALPGIGINLWAAFLADQSPATRTAYNQDMSHFSRLVLGRVDPAAAAELLISGSQGTANAIALAFKADMMVRKLSTATQHRRLSMLRSLVKRARRLGLITWSLEIDMPKVEKYLDTSGPTVHGVRQLLESARSQGKRDASKAARDTAIIRLCYDLGLRRGEVVRLDLADVELDTEPPSIKVIGKGKTQKKRKTLGPAPARALTAWIALRGSHAGPLFHRLDKANANKGDVLRITGDSIARLTDALARKAGMGKVRPHGLRHASITRALDMGLDMRSVQAFSGHADPKTLMKYDDNRQDIAGRVGRQLGDDLGE